MHSTISELYRAFQPYRLGDDWGGCEHCVSADASERLSQTPLDELAVADLDRYSFKAMSTWGEVRHFKYFLPRLLQLAFDEFKSFGFPEVLLGKLVMGKWRSWPRIEQDAVDTFLLAFWNHQLTRDNNGNSDDEIATVLGGLALVFPDIEFLLNHWVTVRGPSAILRLASLIETTADEIMATGTTSCLWGDAREASTQLASWIASDAVFEYLKANVAIVTAQFPDVLSQLDGVRGAINGHE